MVAQADNQPALSPTLALRSISRDRPLVRRALVCDSLSHLSGGDDVSDGGLEFVGGEFEFGGKFRMTWD